MAKYGKCNRIQSAFLMLESNFEAIYDACAIELHTIGKQWKRKIASVREKRKILNPLGYDLTKIGFCHEYIINWCVFPKMIV